MRLRLAIALLAVVGMTAFAPAPFPRTNRRAEGEHIGLQMFQGTWRVANMQTSRSNGQHAPYPWNVTHIRITNDKWEFMTNQTPGNGFPISIDGAKKPAHLTFFNAGSDKRTPTGVAIMRRRGGQIQILYTWGGETSRPKSFEQPPDGPWLLTLER